MHLAAPGGKSLGRIPVTPFSLHWSSTSKGRFIISERCLPCTLGWEANAREQSAWVSLFFPHYGHLPALSTQRSLPNQSISGSHLLSHCKMLPADHQKIWFQRQRESNNYSTRVITISQHSWRLPLNFLCIIQGMASLMRKCLSMSCCSRQLKNGYSQVWWNLILYLAHLGNPKR